MKKVRKLAIRHIDSSELIRCRDTLIDKIITIRTSVDLISENVATFPCSYNCVDNSIEWY